MYTYLYIYICIFFVLPRFGFGPHCLGVVMFDVFVFDLIRRCSVFKIRFAQERCAQTALGGLQGSAPHAKLCECELRSNGNKPDMQRAA